MNFHAQQTTMFHLVRFCLLMAVLGFPVQGWAEQVDVSGQVTVAKSGLRFNRTSNTFDSAVTLTNSLIPLSGPVRLVVSGISTPNVTLANASGTAAEGMPYINLNISGPWNPGASLTTTLKFNNPQKVAFTFKTQVIAEVSSSACSGAPITVVKPTIQQILPTSGATGSAVKIFGSGFTSCSRVFLGDKEITNPQFISDHELEIIVPFFINAQNQVVPLNAGNYPLTVNGSAPQDFTVTALPENPNPAGQLLNDNIHLTFQSLAQVESQFQAMLPDLLQETQNQPNNQKFIQELGNLIYLLNNQGEARFLESITQMDSVTLNTLERAFYAHQLAVNSTAQLPVLNKNNQLTVPTQVQTAAAATLELVLNFTNKRYKKQP